MIDFKKVARNIFNDIIQCISAIYFWTCFAVIVVLILASIFMFMIVPIVGLILGIIFINTPDWPVIFLVFLGIVPIIVSCIIWISCYSLKVKQYIKDATVQPEEKLHEIVIEN